MTQTLTYEESERRALNRQINEVAAAPLPDRKAAQAEYAEAMRDPALIRERLQWLLAGNYGYGAMAAAQDIIARPRVNRVAALSALLAAVEWQCPSQHARAAWLFLSEVEQKAVNAVFAEALA